MQRSTSPVLEPPKEGSGERPRARMTWIAAVAPPSNLPPPIVAPVAEVATKTAGAVRPAAPLDATVLAPVTSERVAANRKPRRPGTDRPPLVVVEVVLRSRKDDRCDD